MTCFRGGLPRTTPPFKFLAGQIMSQTTMQVDPSLPPTIGDAVVAGEPIYVLPPDERQPEISMRADFLSESRDWGHGMLGLEVLHNKGIRGQGVVICVADTGVDATHSDLKDRLDLERCKDFTNSASGYLDRQGHGTHVSGIAFASTNGNGVIGAAPEATGFVAKCLNDQGSGASSWIAAAIRHGVDAGADIISLSLGGPTPDTRTRQAIQYAISKGCWVVCAAGNDGAEVSSYPGHYPESIAVAALDKNGLRANFSTINAENDVAMPGVSILSTLPANRYGTLSGTSMATPYVAGCLALLRGELKRAGKPIPDQPALLEHITRTAIDVQPAGWDKGTGWGLLNVAALIARLVPPPVPPPPSPPPPPVPVCPPGKHWDAAQGKCVDNLPVPPVPLPIGETVKAILAMLDYALKVYESYVKTTPSTQDDSIAAVLRMVLDFLLTWQTTGVKPSQSQVDGLLAQVKSEINAA